MSQEIEAAVAIRDKMKEAVEKKAPLNLSADEVSALPMAIALLVPGFDLPGKERKRAAKTA